MRRLLNHLFSLIFGCAFLPSVGLAQDQYVVGEVETDTTIRFAVSNSGPEYLMHYVVTRCDTMGQYCAANVQIFSLPNGNKLQEWKDTLNFDDPFCSFPDKPTFIDFNFDGYSDICFDCFWSGLREPSFLAFFRQYNPKTKLFDPATQFDKLEGSISIGDDQTIEANNPMGPGEQEWIKNIYKYSHGQLIFIENSERMWEGSGYKLIIKKPVNGVLKIVDIQHEPQ